MTQLKRHGNKLIRIALSVLMCLALVPLMIFSTPTTQAEAALPAVKIGSVTVGQRFGFSRSDLVSYLQSHEHDNFFLGTPYGGGGGTDPTFPNGDPRGQSPLMNCAGFVDYVMRFGLGKTAFPGYWDNWMRSNDLVLYLYDSKADLLADGKAQKGDIIWMFDTANGDNYDKNVGYSSLTWGKSGTSHVGYYWGDSSNNDLFWHSHASARGNEITEIMAKREPSKYALMPLDDGAYLEIQKSSNDPQISYNNRLYDFAGAEYAVYKSAADATNDANRVTTLTTSGMGYAKSAMLAYGNYWVKEVKAPMGFCLDKNVHTINIDGSHQNKLYRLNVADDAQGDPVDIWIYKVDAETGQTSGFNPTLGLPNPPQEAASLKGAVFTIEYYDWLGSTAGLSRSDIVNAAGKAKYTWKIVTDQYGFAYLDQAHLAVDSPDSLIMKYGDATIPRGTFITYESAAPSGYLLPSPTKYHIAQYDENPITGAPIIEPQVATQSDMVVRGDIAVEKVFVKDDQKPGELTPEKGIIFDFYDATNYAKAANGSYAPITGAKVMFSLTTNDEGFADTKSMYVIDNTAIKGSYDTRARRATDSGALPIGTYLGVQRTSPIDVGKVGPFLVMVDANGSYHHYTLGNNSNGSIIKVEKLDVDTGKHIPLPATWSIKDKKTGKLVSMTIPYPVRSTVTEFTSDKDGNLSLPEKLPLGDYELIEVSAPAANGIGYLINPVNVSFKVTEFRDIDDPLVVTMKDAPAKGQIQIVKNDGGSKGGTVSGARYHVYADEDIYTADGTLRTNKDALVADVWTGADGTATTGELFLGRYRILEIESPDGWIRDHKPSYVGLSYINQNARVNIKAFDIVEQPTTINLFKTDTTTGEPVMGTEFVVYQEDKRTFNTADVAKTVADVTHKLASDKTTANEIVTYQYKAADIAIAINNLKTPDAPFYVSGSVSIPATEVHEVKGAYESHDIALFITFNGDRTIDIVVEGIALANIKPQGKAPISLTAITDDKGELKFEYLTRGQWFLTETKASSGYVIDRTVYPFFVNDEGIIEGLDIDLRLTNDQIVCEISKRDITTEEELPGAILEIYKADDMGKPTGDALYYWVSTDKPFEIRGIEAGGYVLREIMSPTDYNLASDINFTITAETKAVQQVVMHDDYDIKLSLSKRDITTDEELPGASLEIYEVDAEGKPTGKALYEWVSSDTPYDIVGIEPGDYILREITAPFGYSVAQDVPFTVDDKAGVQGVVMYDNFIEVEISKRDITSDAELPGATLEVYETDDKGKPTGDPLYHWVSTNKPHLIVGIQPGDYILREITAPKGFSVAQDVPFTVDDKAGVQGVVMYDAPEGSSWDKTGSDFWENAMLGIMLAGCGMVIGAGVFITFAVRRRRLINAYIEAKRSEGEDLTDE